MTETTLAATSRRPTWQRRAMIVLAVTAAVLVALGVLFDDGRFLDTAGFAVGGAFCLLVAWPRRAPLAPGDGPSPWTLGVLLTLAVAGGLTAGLIILAAGMEGTPLQDALLLVVAAPGVVAVAVVMIVLVRAQLRGEHVLATPFPALSAADGRRARGAVALVFTLLLAARLLAIWLPAGGGLPVLGPIAVVVTLTPPIVVLWLARRAAAD